MQLSQEAGPDGTSTLTVSGEVDMSNSADLRAAGIAAASAPDRAGLAIDLSGVTFIDSSGLGALVAIRNAASNASRTVTVVNPSDRARQVIDICGLSPEFGLSPAEPAPAD